MSVRVVQKDTASKPCSPFRWQLCYSRIRPDEAWFMIWGGHHYHISPPNCVNICVLYLVEVFKPLSFIHVDNISVTASKISNKLHTITIILIFGQIQYPILNSISVCIVHFIRVEANWSLQISSIYPWGQYINSNLGDVICGSYITTLLSHKQIIGFLIWAHLKLVIVWYIGGIQSCSTQTSSIYSHGWYVNSDLMHVICSKYITTIVIHEWVKFAHQNRFFAYIVWYICARESVSD